MAFIFWICWLVDLLLLLLALGGKGFRSGFGADTSLNSVVIAITVVVLIASLYLQLSGKPKPAAIVAAMPWLGLFVLYLIEKQSGS